MVTSFRKADLILILGAVAATVALVFALRVTAGARGDDAAGKMVRVSVDGKVLGEYPLSEERDIPIDTEHGHNLLRIENGEVFMVEADCRDGYCLRQGKISGGARSIICLPHRVVAEVIGGEEEDVDLVSG